MHGRSAGERHRIGGIPLTCWGSPGTARAVGLARPLHPQERVDQGMPGLRGRRRAERPPRRDELGASDTPAPRDIFAGDDLDGGGDDEFDVPSFLK